MNAFSCCRHRLACQVSQPRHRKLGSTAKSSGPFLWSFRHYSRSSRMLPTYKPEVKASDVFLCGLHTKNTRPRDLSGGLRGLQTASENIRRAFMWSQPKIIPRNPLCGLRGLLEAGSESIRRVSVRSSPKVIPRDRCLRAMAERLRKRLRGMRGWSDYAIVAAICEI